MRCVQCESLECGDYRCRFSGITHAEYIKQWNDGAAQVKRELEPRPDHDMRCDGMPLKAGR